MQQQQPDTEVFSRLVESVYDSATDPVHWEVFLRGLAQALNGKSGMFRVIDERVPAIRANVHYNLDPELQDAHREYFVTQDLYLEYLHDKPAGFITTGEAALDQQALRKTEFFSDYMLPQDSWHVCGGIAMRNEEFTIKFGLQRDRKTGPFSKEDAEFIRLFVPHIQRAARLGHLLDLAHHQRQTAEQALESLAIGIVLLDEHDHVLHANAKADELLDNRRGIHLLNRQLTVSQQADLRGFRDMLAVVRSRAALDTPPVPESMLLTPGPNDPQLLLVACPVKRHQPHFRGPWPEISVAVFVSNLDDAGLLNHEVLIRLYGLTPAEARLACALSHGHELSDLSAEWNVSRETLRTHLKRVLGKTGTARQSQLVRLLAGKPWSVTPVAIGPEESA